MSIPQIRATTAHLCAIRLCGSIFFLAFLGNVIDGPIMWLLTPPSGGFSAQGLVFLNTLALVPSLLVVVKPKWWPALALCWYAWWATYTNGRLWFFPAFDTMILEIGFLTSALSMASTLFDGELTPQVKSTSADTSVSFSAERAGVARSDNTRDKAVEPLLCRHVDDRNCDSCDLSGRLGSADLIPCGVVVRACVFLAEISLRLVAVRLFFGAGLEKMRVGDRCWKDLTCLYDFYENQPSPNELSWYLHAYSPHSIMQVMQFFSINVAELCAPLFLLSFPIPMGPFGSSWLAQHLLCIPARFCASVAIIVFVMGIFVGGNFAFLHPLSIIPLVASLGTVHGIPAVHPPGPKNKRCSAKIIYRSVAPALVLCMLVFAFLPSLRAYAWILSGSEDTGSYLEPLMASPLVQRALDMHLGIPYERHEYFANPIHSRHEVVFSAQVGNEWFELEVPYKVGRPERRPWQTSPLHRRFAWQMWFLPLEGNPVVGGAADPAWLHRFMSLLCQGHKTAWAALLHGPAHGHKAEVRRIAVQVYQYRMASPFSAAWWTREPCGNTSKPHLELVCGRLAL